jgi:DNA mismatch endonuclease (patch repair protein)
MGAETLVGQEPATCPAPAADTQGLADTDLSTRSVAGCWAMKTHEESRPPLVADGAWSPPDGSWASSPANRKSMQGNRSKDTKPELALRSLLHASGLRYRVNRIPIKGTRRRADIVFGPAKVAVFVDGCFWHGCPQHYRAPKTNEGYWEPKIAGNIARDRETDALLAEAGWLALRFWEHQPPAECAIAVMGALAARRPMRRP